MAGPAHALWALVSGHWSAWQAARVEVEQMAEADDLKQHPVEQRVVADLLQHTTIEPAVGSDERIGADHVVR